MRRPRRAPRHPVTVALIAALSALAVVAGGLAGSSPRANAADDLPGFQTAPGGALFTTLPGASASIPFPYDDRLVRGPDGHLWFTEDGSTLYSVASDGTVVAHPIVAGVGGSSTNIETLKASADGDLWFVYGDAVIRVGADGQEHIVATVPGTISTWSFTDDSRIVVESSSHAGWTISWVAFDGTVTSYPHAYPDESVFTSTLAPGPAGTVWGTRESDGQRTLLRPDGTAVPVTLPPGTASGTAVWDIGRGLVTYGPQTSSSIGRLEVDGTITPLVVTPRVHFEVGSDVLYSTTPAGQPTQLRSLNNPSWSATIPLPDTSSYGACVQSSTGTIWFAGYDPVASQGTLFSIAPDGTVTARLRSYSPYDLVYCSEARDGTLWASFGANISFSVYLRVSPDGSKVTYDSFGPNTSGPLVATDDGTAWMPSYAPDASQGAAGLGHLSYADTSRTSGADRFASAAAVADAAFPSGSRVVFLANGLGFADALAAGPAAAAAGGPLLLASADQLGDATSAELTRLHPSRVVLAGGAAALGPAVAQQVARLLPSATIEREAGPDRYATAAAIDSAAFPSADTVYVATGTGFPDALSASAAAGSGHDPVLLVDGRDNTVDPAGRALLTRLHPNHIVVVGGPAAVSDALLADLGTIAPATRIGGADRFAVAAAVAAAVFPDAKTAFFANGLTFPDALAGSVWAAREHAPLLTVGQNCVPASTATSLMNAGTSTIHLLGGTAALDPALESLTRC
ncbi:cell wall-binding repeat-containing protein [Leifsonia sp. NPDC056665]|uniref:cell wall-binding repeat-containing protein n=1 Tax=Leifsonia sp. NPDC056665 TaxID=3345901 RepID=UPI0036A50E24